MNAGWEVLFEDKAIADITFADIPAHSGAGTTVGTRAAAVARHRRPGHGSASSTEGERDDRFDVGRRV
jgi:hypothetical protein